MSSLDTRTKELESVLAGIVLVLTKFYDISNGLNNLMWLQNSSAEDEKQAYYLSIEFDTHLSDLKVVLDLANSALSPDVQTTEPVPVAILRNDVLRLVQRIASTAEIYDKLKYQYDIGHSGTREEVFDQLGGHAMIDNPPKGWGPMRLEYWARGYLMAQSVQLGNVASNLFAFINIFLMKLGEPIYTPKKLRVQEGDTQ